MSADPSAVTVAIVTRWLLTFVVSTPIWLFAGWVLAHLLAQTPVMGWTRPGQVPEGHPLLAIEGERVRYLGGTKYPLPVKFGWLNGGMFVPVFFLWNSFYGSTDGYGIPYWTRLGLTLAVLVPVILPMQIVFCRLQPRWLNEHLAKRPPDAAP